MIPIRSQTVIECLLAVWFLPVPVSGQDDTPSASRRRVPWTTSRITGSPALPAPYRIERLYPELAFDQPVAMVNVPGSERTVLVERKGRVVQLPADRSDRQPQLMLDGAGQISELTAVYGLAFPPDFQTNRVCFVCYICKPDLEDGTRLSRFQVTGEGGALRIDPDTETTLLTWKSGGHNGGCLTFGPDGFLYVSTGDGSPPAPADVRRSGQDLSDLLASVLRIDVNRTSSDRAYSIPADNPFVELDGARGEVWAFGLRNPWRMSFDRQTGHLWLGDVGWQLWECVHRIEKGGNYGWSLREGPQSVHPEWKRGPAPITPPVKAHPRSEAASVTGGYVYRGTDLRGLTGAYIYGDYVTGKIWSLRYDGQRVTEHRELADTTLAVIAFHEDHEGELSMMDYNGGGIYRLVSNETSSQLRTRFPQRLSETGLFTSTQAHQTAPGVIPFAVNVEQWMDGATAERFVAVPDSGRMVLRKPAGRVPTDWGEFPVDTVLVKTISMEMESGNPASRRRIETQILHNRGELWRGNSGEWFGYSYAWNQEQTDAELLPPEGKTVSLLVTDKEASGGRRRVTRTLGRQTECYLCHNPWAGYRLGFTAAQLNRPQHAAAVAENQLKVFQRIGLLETPDISGQPPFCDAFDTTAELSQRARSWLHVNCAHCHRFGGGGSASLDLRFDQTLAATRTLDQRPTQGTFGIDGARLIRSGDPYRSLLYYRISKLGQGRMPHVGSHNVDRRGVRLIEDWISQLESQADQESIVARQRHEQKLMQSVFRDSDEPAIAELLQSTSGALRLASALGDDYVDQAISQRILQQASTLRAPEVRDLFERFLPEEQRSQRLGTGVRPQAVLALRGDPAAGGELFTKAKGLQCRNCHALNDTGGGLGPPLTQIARTRSREQLLDSILNPSREVEPRYQTWLVETMAGKLYTGLITQQTDTQITLKVAADKQVAISRSEVDLLVRQQRSLMPELQFRDLTIQQLADLLAFLAVQK
ncbi:MAG: PQQ-dependent sugar dehydrogenase [Planctomycetaceae bacterium]